MTIDVPEADRDGDAGDTMADAGDAVADAGDAVAVDGSAGSESRWPVGSVSGGFALGEVLVSKAQLSERIAQIASQITRDYAGRQPLLIGVLKGAFIFMADLARAIQLPVEMDFMAVSSYGTATKTSGIVRIVKDLDVDLTGRDVIIVEDIVDSGLTLSYLRKGLLARDPASLEICALLVKQGQQRVQIDLAYTGFEIPPEFVVGYGLDVAERWRNLSDIRVASSVASSIPSDSSVES